MKLFLAIIKGECEQLYIRSKTSSSKVAKSMQSKANFIHNQMTDRRTLFAFLELLSKLKTYKNYIFKRRDQLS